MKKIIFTVLVASVSLMSCGEEKAPEKETISGSNSETTVSIDSGNADVAAENNLSSIEDVITEFKACKTSAEKKHACKQFVAKAICKYYNIDDFKNEGDYDASGLNEFIDYDDIFEQINSSSNWSKLGAASDQDALDKAQENANKGIATVAIDVSKNNKTVVLIIKGKQVRSTSWGVNCPVSAALNASKPAKSFVGKTLNYSFSNPASIVLYTRD